MHASVSELRYPLLLQASLSKPLVEIPGRSAGRARPPAGEPFPSMLETCLHLTFLSPKSRRQLNCQLLCWLRSAVWYWAFPLQGLLQATAVRLGRELSVQVNPELLWCCHVQKCYSLLPARKSQSTEWGRCRPQRAPWGSSFLLARR